MKVRIFIAGPKVQEVGYRAFLLGMASELNVERFYANNVEGGVQVLAEGDEPLLNRLVEKIRSQKPPMAEVTEVRVDKHSGEVPKRESFALSFMADQMSKMVQAGISMLGKQDTMIEKQDTMIEKQDEMLGKMDIMIEKQDEMLGKQDTMIEKQDEMLGKMDIMIEKQDEMLGKQDETLNEVKGMREDLRTLLHREIESLRKDVDELKKVITRIETRLGMG